MRKRFNAAERAAFVVGAIIEWRNGSHWHPGVITMAPIRNVDGWECVGLTHTGRATRTIHTGQYLQPGPTFVRVPVAAVTA